MQFSSGHVESQILAFQLYAAKRKGFWVAGPHFFTQGRTQRRIQKRAFRAAREFLAGKRGALGGRVAAAKRRRP